MQRTRLAITTTLLIASLAALGGCNIVGAATLALYGQGEVKAAYTLDPSKRTVILIDDPANKISRTATRVAIGETAQNLLLEKNIIRDGLMIDTTAATVLAARDSYENPLSVVEIGQSIDAEIVIYVVVAGFSPITTGFDTEARPTADLTLTIVDVAEQRAVWPATPGGEPFTVQSPISANLDQSSRTNRLNAETALARRVGLALAQMFYDVEVALSARR
ncbi:MAG: hypothetical protein AAGI17_02710 [Planctomycetota bacterium]